MNGNMYPHSENGVSSSGSHQHPSNRRFAYYAMTALALLALLLINQDGAVVVDPDPELSELAPEAKIGYLSPQTPRRILQISLLGERNSGTRWTYSHLVNCFNKTIRIKRDFTRYKHWFQHKNASRYQHNTLVIAQFRNPYDWLEAMRHVPHHAPNHMFLDWEEFLTKEWSMERTGLDLTLPEAVKNGHERCQQNFKYQDIISCVLEPVPKEAFNHTLHFSENQPFYEMRPDGSGKPFKNIMEFRAGKIRNFMELKDHKGVADVWSIQYEYLLKMGTKRLLDQISDWTGIPYTCKPFESQERTKRPLTREYARFLNQNLDWNAEGLIGYVQEPVDPEPAPSKP